MTVKEAIEQKINKIRLPEWAEDCWAELPEIGVWVKICDPYAGNSEMLVFDFIRDDLTTWEKYEEI